MSWNVASIPNQQGKTVLITGANSGIGFEAAKVFTGKGAKVILACRNQNKGADAITAIKQDIPAADLELMNLDLSSLSSVASFAESFKQRYDKLDILVNNAGVMAPPYSKTADGFESQFGTNHLGHFALTGQLLALLEKADAGRVVVVSSVAHRVGRINFNDLNCEKRYSRWLAYGQSKLANLLFAKELQRRLQQQGSSVRSVAVHPGYSNTNLQQFMPGHRLFNAIFSQPQQDGCMPTLYAATHDSIQGGEYIGPDGFMEIKGMPKRAYANRRSQDENVAKRLWQVSEALTQVNYLSAA
jgi:NAD(P)-dependent dehydrogenase (short-subunit alcohol dehydrogenase family)